MSFRDRAPLLFILLVVATWGGRGYRGLDGVGLVGVGLDGVGLDGVGLDALAFHTNFWSLKLSVSTSTKINIIKSTLNNYDTKLSQILLIF